MAIKTKPELLAEFANGQHITQETMEDLIDSTFPDPNLVGLPAEVDALQAAATLTTGSVAASGPLAGLSVEWGLVGGILTLVGCGALDAPWTPQSGEYVLLASADDIPALAGYPFSFEAMGSAIRLTSGSPSGTGVAIVGAEGVSMTYQGGSQAGDAFRWTVSVPVAPIPHEEVPA